MRYTTAFTVRAARLLLLILAVIGLQPVSTAGQAAEPTSPTHVSPAVLLAGPPVPLPVSGLEQQDGDGRAPSSANDPLAGEHAGRDTTAGACTAGFCPWRASDALARAGRRSSPATAPPTSPV